MAPQKYRIVPSEESEIHDEPHLQRSRFIGSETAVDCGGDHLYDKETKRPQFYSTPSICVRLRPDLRLEGLSHSFIQGEA